MNRDSKRLLFKAPGHRIVLGIAALAAMSLWSCGNSEAGPDSGVDVHSDVGPDSGVDVHSDVGPDSGVDVLADADAASGVDLSEMTFVPEGSAIIGCRPWGEPDSEPCGRLEPLEQEKYFEAFWIDTYEVTNREFADFLNTLDEETARPLYLEDPPTNRIVTIPIQISMSDSEWVVANNAEERPVVNVTWGGARAYCAALGKRIPTSDEWEKAARGTEGNLYPWGNSYGPQECAMTPSQSEYRTYIVGACNWDISPFGVKDMGSNVMEWVEEKSVYKDGWRTTKGNYLGSPGSPMFSWHYGGPEAPPQSDHDTAWGDAIAFEVGFRCVVSLEQDGK